MKNYGGHAACPAGRTGPDFVGERGRAPPSSAPPSSRGAGFWRWALYVVYCVEVGVVLALLPWTQYWEGNRFFRDHALMMKIGASGYARGAVSALGVFLFFAGLAGLWERARKRKK